MQKVILVITKDAVTFKVLCDKNFSKKLFLTRQLMSSGFLFVNYVINDVHITSILYLPATHRLIILNLGTNSFFDLLCFISDSANLFTSTNAAAAKTTHSYPSSIYTNHF